MKRAVVIDLDGTLVRCNSFSLYVRQMMWHCPMMMVYAAMRKLRLISHARAKQLIMAVNVTDTMVDAFVDVLQTYVRAELLKHDADEVVVLATAAPNMYAEILAQRFGIKYCVASNVGAPENKGEEKCESVKALLKRENLELYRVITDHVDDYPLLRENVNGCNVLINPSEKTVSSLKRNNIKFSSQF